MSAQSKRVGFAVVAALAVGAGVAALVVLVGGGSSGSDATQPGHPGDLAIAVDGDEVQACLGSGEVPVCVEGSRVEPQLDARLDHWPDAGVSVLVVLAPDDVELLLTPDPGSKRLPGFVAVTATVQGAPRCVQFGMRSADGQVGEVSVHLTVAGDEGVSAVAADAPCPRLSEV